MIYGIETTIGFFDNVEADQMYTDNEGNLVFILGSQVVASIVPGGWKALVAGDSKTGKETGKIPVEETVASVVQPTSRSEDTTIDTPSVSRSCAPDESPSATPVFDAALSGSVLDV